MGDLIKLLRRAADDRSLSIGDAWHLLDAAADEIERLQANAHALAAERLCRAVEVAVLIMADFNLLTPRQYAELRGALNESTRAPEARKEG